jgi:hypothetical protein
VERGVDLVLAQVRGAGRRRLHDVGEQLDLDAEGLVGQLGVGLDVHTGTTPAEDGGYGRAGRAAHRWPFG